MMIAVIDLIKNEWIPYEILHKLATNNEKIYYNLPLKSVR